MPSTTEQHQRQRQRRCLQLRVVLVFAFVAYTQLTNIYIVSQSSSGSRLELEEETLTKVLEDKFAHANTDTGSHFEAAPSTSINTTKVNTALAPTSTKVQPELVFISAKFGRDAMFASEMAAHRARVTATGVFDSDHMFTYSEFPDWILNDTRWTEHLRFLTPEEEPQHASKKGGGYWFWKPVLIAHHLQELKEGDFLVYSDSDTMNHFNWTHRLITEMQQRQANLALYGMGFLERRYTKGDTYGHYCDGNDNNTNLTPANDTSFQHCANTLIIQKNRGSIQFIQEWMEGVANYQMINDSPSKLPNARDFKVHRHDQSILNALLKCRHHSNGKQLFLGTKIPLSENLDQGGRIVITWDVYTYQV